MTNIFRKIWWNKNTGELRYGMMHPIPSQDWEANKELNERLGPTNEERQERIIQGLEEDLKKSQEEAEKLRQQCEKVHKHMAEVYDMLEKKANS